MSYQLRILSLGAGVQSTAIFLMSCLGVLPRVHCAIFADTGWESTATYQHLEWLEKIGKEEGIPIIRVSGGSIRDGLMNRENARQCYAPYFIKTPDAVAMGRRQCTYNLKISPIRNKTRELLGLKPRQRAPQGAVEQWIGISLDELRRTRGYRPDRMTHVRFPLIEWKLMSRQQCIQWIAENYPGHVPPKSSCIGCPYHSDNEWRALTEAEFADACTVDEALRNARGLKYPAFLHRSCVPLAEVDFTDNQMRLPFAEVQKHELIIGGLFL